MQAMSTASPSRPQRMPNTTPTNGIRHKIPNTTSPMTAQSRMTSAWFAWKRASASFGVQDQRQKEEDAEQVRKDIDHLFLRVVVPLSAVRLRHVLPLLRSARFALVLRIVIFVHDLTSEKFLSKRGCPVLTGSLQLSLCSSRPHPPARHAGRRAPRRRARPFARRTLRHPAAGAKNSFPFLRQMTK